VIEVVVCKSGKDRHAPTLDERLAAVGAQVSTVECFDRCDTCERFLLARVDGAMMRLRNADELVATVVALGEAG
jgi:uncharacterized protein YuzB (UPF0349 family)